MHRLARLRTAARSEDGVTLVETLVALSILSLAVVRSWAGCGSA